MESQNWEVEPTTDDTKKKFYINVCRSLVQMGGQCACLCSSPTLAEFSFTSLILLGIYILENESKPTMCSPSVTGSWKCPSSAASCLKVGDEYVSLGQLESGPTWDMSVLKLQYTSGQACPDGRRNRSSIIRFKCDKDKVVRVHRTND